MANETLDGSMEPNYKPRVEVTAYSNCRFGNGSTLVLPGTNCPPGSERAPIQQGTKFSGGVTTNKGICLPCLLLWIFLIAQVVNE